MKLLLQRELKQRVPEQDRSVTIVEGKEYLVDETKDFSTKHGTVTAKDLKSKDGTVIKSNQNKEFIVLTPTFIDIFTRLRKGPQSINLKDIGTIVAETGVGKDSIVVDAGAGSGALSSFLAHLVKKVTTYEIKDDYLENIKENFKQLGLKNITLKHADIMKGIAEKKVDLVTLDMPNSAPVVPIATDALAIGGHLVGYCPHVTQVIQFLEAIRKDARLQHSKTLETIQREWGVDEMRSRPSNAEIGHTAFLIFARRIK